jgi:hypothetical protein
MLSGKTAAENTRPALPVTVLHILVSIQEIPDMAEKSSVGT